MLFGIIFEKLFENRFKFEFKTNFEKFELKQKDRKTFATHPDLATATDKWGQADWAKHAHRKGFPHRGLS